MKKQTISLAAARINARMTQRELAEHLNVSPATIVRWESGKSDIPAFAFRELCKLAGVDESDIFLPKVQS